MAFPRWLHLLIALVVCAHFSLAEQKCWRDTVCSGPKDSAFPGGPWTENIYAPDERTVRPRKVLTLTNRNKAIAFGDVVPYKLRGNGSSVVFDFGIEVGGIVTLNYSSEAGKGALGLAFSEAKNWIGEWSDSSNGRFEGPDGAVYANFSEAGNTSYTMPDRVLRGGFRYLTVFLLTDEEDEVVRLRDVTLEIAFQPTWSNLQAYQGYFHSNDELLNRIWYSGAYTLQTNAAPVNTGRQVPMLKKGWANDATMGPGDTIIMDGAKRDRAVWPGDMGIAVPAAFVSTGDLESVKNALQVMYDLQDKNGAFDESGPPLSQKNSDTYHMWTMIGTYNYVLYTNDTSFLQHNWKKYQKAMDYVYGKVDSSGLLNVTGTRDWARWQQGFNNSQAQMILYHTLTTASTLASWAESTNHTSTNYTARASLLKEAINTHCFDPSHGSFKDNATDTSLHPQDANSLALLYGITDSTRAESISESLMENWTPIGAVTPELPGNISPFISSFEIQGHLAIGQTARALELIRRCWGWYANHPNGTGSTVIEGYLANGTFGYRGSRGYGYDDSYVSHAHGWSAGPTAALTTYVLGLSITSPLGVTWRIAPQFGDLRAVEGGFTTSLGKFRVEWKREGDGKGKGKDGYSLVFEVPGGTRGNLTLPFLERGVKPGIKIDGNDVERGVEVVGETATVTVSGGGRHRVVVS